MKPSLIRHTTMPLDHPRYCNRQDNRNQQDDQHFFLFHSSHGDIKAQLKRNQQENLKDFARFFKEYAPRYGYKYLCTENDDYKYYQTLVLKLIHKGFFRQYNYGLPLKELRCNVDFYIKERIFLSFLSFIVLCFISL